MAINNLIDQLNNSQRLAATHTGSHALVLAGAGSGKTRTIIARAGFLIHSGVPADRIQILTFTRRSAHEIVERVKAHLGDRASHLGASTFHTWCMSLIRSMPKAFGCKGHTVIDRDDQLMLFKSIRGKDAKGKQLPTAANLCDIYSYARNTRSSLTKTLESNWPNYVERKSQIAEIAKAYEDKKRERHYLDYDDILDVVASVLRSDPEIRQIVCQQYDHFLVDEMQDTNPLQWDLLDAVKEKAQLFCVGDDAQSIYAFRGADFRNVHSFTDRVPDSTILRLNQNYRSTQEILDLSNWLLEQSPLDYNKRLVAIRGTGGVKPRLLNFFSEWDEGRWIADDIQKRQANGSSWKDHMVLMRSGFSGRAVESALLALEIPYVLIGGTSLLQTAHVRDLLSVLRLVANHSDEIAWMRFLTQWPRVGDVTAAELFNRIMGVQSIDESIDVLRSDPRLSPELIETVTQVAANSGSPYEAFITAKTMMNDLLATNYRDSHWELRQSDFAYVGELTKRHDSILGFIEEYLLDPVWTGLKRSREDTDNDKVTLITIHSAKGMEKPVCYVVNVSPDSFPSAKTTGNLDEVEEERRVLYVAMTRAQNELIVSRRGYAFSATGTRRIVGDDEEPETYFLNNLPSEYVEEETVLNEQRGLRDANAERVRPSIGIDLS